MLRAIFDRVLYRGGYFGMVEATSTQSAGPMAKSLVTEFRPRRVVDYGCGTGALIAAFRSHGVEAVGTEWSPVAQRRCAAKGVEALRVDLRQPPSAPPLDRASLATSFEVAEHLPASAASMFVHLLCETAPLVAFSAATPGQGGQGHINEQPHSYWIDFFRREGFAFDHEISEKLRLEWSQSGVACWYSDNLMIFRSVAPSAEGESR